MSLHSQLIEFSPLFKKSIVQPPGSKPNVSEIFKKFLWSFEEVLIPTTKNSWFLSLIFYTLCFFPSSSLLELNAQQFEQQLWDKLLWFLKSLTWQAESTWPSIKRSLGDLSWVDSFEQILEYGPWWLQALGNLSNEWWKWFVYFWRSGISDTVAAAEDSLQWLELLNS